MDFNQREWELTELFGHRNEHIVNMTVIVLSHSLSYDAKLSSVELSFKRRVLDTIYVPFTSINCEHKQHPDEFVMDLALCATRHARSYII